MPLACKQCGANLPPPPPQTLFVPCPYCRTTNDIRQPVNIHVHQYGNAPPPAPAMPPMAPPPQPPVTPAPTSKAPLLAMFLITSLIAVGGAVAALVGSSGSAAISGPASPGEPGAAKPAGPKNWRDPCLVDANGDGTLDLAGLGGVAGKSSIPGILDGKTGELLFSDESLGKQAKLICLSERWILAGADDFELRLYDARTPDPPNRARGSDKLRHARLGKDCVAIRTEDDESMGLALPSGTATNCPVELPKYVRRDEPGVLGLTDEETTIQRGKRTIIFRKKRSGSGKLSLEVKEGGRTTLDRKLPYISATFGAGVAATKDRIIFTGAKPGVKDKSYLIGLDAEGKELYNHRLPGPATSSIDFMAFNNRYVVVGYFAGVRAFRPDNGELVWQAAR